MANIAVLSHFAELWSRYSMFRLSERFDKQITVHGLLEFSAIYEGVQIDDEYSVQIVIPSDYPYAPPSALELGERIPDDFHKFSDGTLCLGAPIAVKKTFFQNPTLVGFVEYSLIPYLYSFSHLSKYGTLPYGELAHGPFGILEHYLEYFSVSSPEKVLRLLNFLAVGKYRGHNDCPCKSGKRLRNCHGERLMEIQQFQPSSNFATEFKILVQMFSEKRQEYQAAIRHILQKRHAFR